MTDVHPTLERVARAICRAQTGHTDVGWRQWLPEARAAVTALADEVRVYEPSDLREIAAEPKPPAAEDVLATHREHPANGSRSDRCVCGWFGLSFATHVAEKLREAGLLKEES